MGRLVRTIACSAASSSGGMQREPGAASGRAGRPRRKHLARAATPPAAPGTPGRTHPATASAGVRARQVDRPAPARRPSSRSQSAAARSSGPRVRPRAGSSRRRRRPRAAPIRSAGRRPSGAGRRRASHLELNPPRPGAPAAPRSPAPRRRAARASRPAPPAPRTPSPAPAPARRPRGRPATAAAAATAARSAPAPPVPAAPPPRPAADDRPPPGPARPRPPAAAGRLSQYRCRWNAYVGRSTRRPGAADRRPVHRARRARAAPATAVTSDASGSSRSRRSAGSHASCVRSSPVDLRRPARTAPPSGPTSRNVRDPGRAQRGHRVGEPHRLAHVPHPVPRVGQLSGTSRRSAPDTNGTRGAAVRPADRRDRRELGQHRLHQRRSGTRATPAAAGSARPGPRAAPPTCGHRAPRPRRPPPTPGR